MENTGRRPIRVLYVDSAVGIAGGQLSILELIRTLDRSAVLPEVCSPPRSGLRGRCRDWGIRWRPLPFESPRAGRSGAAWRIADVIASAWGVLYLAGLLLGCRVDVLHANNFKAGLVGGLACVLTRRPMIFHDRVHIRHGALGSVVAALSTRIIVVSAAVGAKHANRREKVSMVHDGIDLERFAPTDAEASGNTVGFVGRISEEKGVHVLVECAGRVLERFPDTQFLVAGEPFTPPDVAYLERVRRLARDLGLAERVQFLGFVEDVRTVLRRCSIVVLPSTNEPFGIVILEAMASGLPVVCFDVGGPREIISPGVDGILVEPGNADALAAAMVGLLDDRQAAAEIGRKARMKVAARFTREAMAAATTEVYDEAQRGRRAGRGSE